MSVPSSVRRLLAVVAIGLGALVLVALPALAQDDESDRSDDEHIVLSGELIVPSGQSVSTAVSFNGDATIDGTVTETLVVFNGGATVTGTVRQDVIVFNGPVVVAEGATVGGDIISRETPQVADGADVRGNVTGVDAAFMDWADAGLVGRFAWWLAYSISTLVLGLLLLAIAPRLDIAIYDAASRRRGASIGVGAALFFLTPIVAVILMVTIVGIPLGLFLLLALALLYTVGYVAGAHAIGRHIVKPPSSRYVAFLAGLGIVRVLGLVPILGGLVWTLVTIFGLGALFVATRRGTQRGETVVPAPPPPALPR